MVGRLVSVPHHAARTRWLDMSERSGHCPKAMPGYSHHIRLQNVYPSTWARSIEQNICKAKKRAAREKISSVAGQANVGRLDVEAPKNFGDLKFLTPGDRRAG